MTGLEGVFVDVGSVSAQGLGYRDFEEGVASTVEYLKQLKSRGVQVLCANMEVSRFNRRRHLLRPIQRKTTACSLPLSIQSNCYQFCFSNIQTQGNLK